MYKKFQSKFSPLTPSKVLKRAKSYPTIVVVGPTGAGKSTLIYSLINHRVVSLMQLGIGESSQTTLIQSSIVFDERIERDGHFAIRIRFKEFAAKDIDICLIRALAALYLTNDRDIEDTLDSIDSKWMKENVLEPEDTRYHLEKLFSEETGRDLEEFVEAFKNAIVAPLSEILDQDEEFDARVKEIRKSLGDKKVKVKEIREDVFEEFWHAIDEEILAGYRSWLMAIGEFIKEDICKLLNIGDLEDFEGEFSAEEGEDIPYGGHILRNLYDAKAAYSLLVDECLLACRPRIEMLEAHAAYETNWPLRFVLRDTMGLNQIGIDGGSIKDALEIAYACNPDAILFLMGLGEIETVTTQVCKAIQERDARKNGTKIPKYLIFTKPDIHISSVINKEERATVELTQEDYNANIDTAIKSVEDRVDAIVGSLIDPESYTWLSLRYLAEDIDPIQKALKETGNENISRFRPDGLYTMITDKVEDIQISRLPKDAMRMQCITVEDAELPAIEITVDSRWNDLYEKDMIDWLTKNKATINGYLITDDYRISGRSVVAYYSKLRLGLGHTTRAYVYGNFSINMKGLMNRFLHEFIKDIGFLYEPYMVTTNADNISEQSIQYLAQYFDKDGMLGYQPLADANPRIMEKLTAKEIDEQKLHKAFMHYFQDQEQFNMLLDMTAYRISYGNDEIRSMIDSIYNKPISYDVTIREMQRAYQKLFATPRFYEIVAEELGGAMTDIINKMFVVV